MKRILLACLLAAVAIGAQAQQAKKPVVLHPSIPPVESVKDAPFPGWLELGAGGKTFYLSQDGRFMMLGKVVDLGVQPGAAGAPADAETQEEDSPVDVSKLPVNQAIKYVNGNGKNKIYVFSDPDCPYCRKFEEEMGQLANTTIYMFPYPLDSLHPDARKKAVSLWCQSDRAAAWHETLTKGRFVKDATCPNPVDANVALGRSLNIFGTPTIFMPDGRRIVGYVPATAINQYLSGK